MAATASKQDLYKLETIFDADNNVTIHITPTPGLTATQEDSGALTKWMRKKEIGIGGFGLVWLEEAQGGQLRAVKRVPKEVANVDWSRELIIMAQLRNHEILFVQFFGWYEHKGYVYFAMEYLEGGDLGQYMKACGPQAKSQVKKIITQLLEGLVVLHEQNICHRDIKPKNILIASTLPIRVKITDFGLSKDHMETSLRTNCGTSGYRAPELQGFIFSRKRSKGSYTNSVDIWSLGILTHEILTSEIPFLLLDDSDSDIGSGIKPKLEGEPEPLMVDMGLLSDYCRGKKGFPARSLQESRVSKEGTQFVVSLLAANPRHRVSATIALTSQWLLDGSKELYCFEGGGDEEIVEEQRLER